MKKVLIFWRGMQAHKHISYFSHLGYSVETVSRTAKWYDYCIQKNYIFLELSQKSPDFFASYSYIVVAVSPYINQTEVLLILTNTLIPLPIIIEKPITYDDNLLLHLQSMSSVYFYIDELKLSNFYSKLLNSDSEIMVYLPSSDKNYYSHILEHALWGLLLSENFSQILENVVLFFDDDINKDSYLYYRIYCDKKYKITCEQWTICLNNIRVTSLDFSECLDFFLSLSSEDIDLHKKNFLKLRQFISLC